MSGDVVTVGKELARRSRKAQGLPAQVEDEAVAARVAAILRAAPDPAPQVEGRSGEAS